jgi:hypothetical protein
MNLSIILQVVMAIPKIVSMVASVVKAVKEMQAKIKESALADAVLKAQSAKTKAEAEIANKEITTNIP